MIKVFPVAGGARYSDDFGAPRGTPQNPRTHQGNDLLATAGTPILATDDGTVTYYTDGIGGPSFILKMADGSRAYGTHLQGYAFGIAVGQDTRATPISVRAGDVIGLVGHSGNAGSISHLHFQFWLPNGQLVDPYPYLRQAQIQNAPAPLATPASHSWAVPVAILAATATAAYFLRVARLAHRVIRSPVGK